MDASTVCSNISGASTVVDLTREDPGTIDLTDDDVSDVDEILDMLEEEEYQKQLKQGGPYHRMGCVIDQKVVKKFKLISDDFVFEVNDLPKELRMLIVSYVGDYILYIVSERVRNFSETVHCHCPPVLGPITRSPRVCCCPIPAYMHVNGSYEVRLPCLCPQDKTRGYYCYCDTDPREYIIDVPQMKRSVIPHQPGPMFCNIFYCIPLSWFDEASFHENRLCYGIELTLFDEFRLNPTFHYNTYDGAWFL